MHDTHVGIRGDVELYDLSVVIEVSRAVVKIRPIPDHEIATRAVSRAGRGRADMVGRCLVHGRRRGERGTALPAFDDARIARGGHAARSEIGPHEERAVVDPCDAGLRFRNLESIGDKVSRGEIELPQLRGVRAAAREADEAAAVFWLEAGRARPGPRHALSLAQRVEVDHRLPPRIRTGVARPCGPPPNAALVISVLPKVVERTPKDAGVSDLVLGIEDLLEPIEERLIQRSLAQDGNRCRVLGIHPLHGARTFDVLEPDERVIRRGAGRSRLLHSEGKDEEQVSHGRPPGEAFMTAVQRYEPTFWSTRSFGPTVEPSGD